MNGPIEEVFPLSPMQQGLLFHSLASADPAVYTVQVCCAIEGDLDHAALQSAWQAVIDLHPALRSDFDWEELEEPVQVVHRSLRVEVEHRGEEGLEGFLAADRRRPFRLSEAPLLRLSLLRAGGLRHLVWTYHHGLLDGWSALLVLGQVFAAYAALRQGRPPDLVPPRRCSDYVAWLRGLDLEAAEAFWRCELRGFREPTPLPVRLARDGHGTPRRAGTALLPEQTAALRSFARRRRLTLNTLVRGAWALALGRLAGEEEVLFGATVSGRPPELAGADSMVGLFLNTLPVRAPVPPDATLEPWLAALQARQIAVRQSQHVPLAVIQEWSELPRDRPLFDSLLIYENHPVSGSLLASADGVRLRRLRFDGATHYPLALTVLPGASLDLEIAYDGSRIEDAAARGLLSQVANLLATFTRCSGETLAALPALTPAERHQALVEQNDTRQPVPAEGVLHRWFEAQAARSPAAVAVVCGERRLAYAELNGGANRLARRLLALGAVRGEPVAVRLARSERVPVAWLAVLKAGGAYLPIDPSHPPERVAAMLEGAGARIVLTDQDFDGRDSPRAGEEDLGLPVEPEDLAYVLFTSGSTGRPKGVAVPHGAVLNLLAAFARRLDFRPGKTLLALTTFSFDIAGLEILLPLVTGGSVAIAPPEAVGNGPLLAGLLEDEGVDVVQATPSGWLAPLAAGWRGRPGLTLLCGGEALPRPLAERLLPAGDALHNLYGPTETTIWSFAGQVEEGTGTVPIGRPLANTRAYVLDAHLQPLPAGLPGELYIAGAGLARGYVGLPAETAERFVPDPWGGEPGARMYRTGDRVLRRPDGACEFLGRLDHQVKVRGFRVEPGEVEAALARHPGIREAAVAARAEEDGRRLAAYLVARGDPPSPAELGRFLRQRLPEPLVPSAFVFLPALPRTANGKLDRRSLPEPGRERPAVETAFREPRDETEERLAAIWSAVLKLDRVGVFDNFFELGGDSIRSLQVVARAAQQGLRLTPDQIFACRTIAALAAETGAAAPALPEVDAGPPSPSGEIEAFYPVSRVQQGMLFHSLLAPGSAVYFEQAACTLEGGFRQEVFRRAWQQVAGRHPVLRSSFSWSGGEEPRQVVFRHVELPWASEDLRELPAERKAGRLEEILAADRRRGFDHERAPLLRHALIRLSESRWRWIWSFHHALLDGWSVARLLAEVFTLYGCLIRGEEVRLPAPASLRGYHAWLAERDLADEEAWWRGYLEELPGPTVLDLGGAGGEPGYGTREIHLSATDTQALAAAARRAGLTLHTVLQGAWALLLARYSGESAVVFGTTSSGRPAALPDAESLVGLFVSTLPARVAVPATAPPAAWLEDLQQQQARMRRFERSPLTDIQGWSRIPRGLPLFECVEVLESYPADLIPRRDLAGLEVSDLSLFERTSYPLSFMALPGPRLTLRLLYDRARCEEAAMARMAGHLANLLLGLLAGHGRIADLPMLGAAERHQLLAEWNDVRAPRGDGVVLDLFARQAARAPEAVAAVEEGREALSYGELDRRSNQLARSLARQGAGPGGVVALAMPPGLEMIVGVVGVLKAGAAYLPLDPEAPPERLAALVADSGARILLGRGDVERALPGSSAEPPGLRPASELTAYLIYTSGSTGRPKGVAVGHASLLNLVRWHLDSYGMGPRDRMTLLANPSFDASVWELWPALACGASLWIVPREVRADPDRLRSWLGERAVTLCFLPTPLAEVALERPWPPGSELRILLTGGERLRRGPAHPSPFALVNHYGPTEAAVVTTAAPVDPAPGPAPPIGRPIANAAVYLLGPGLDPVPLGAAGELFIGGPGLAQGYAGRPDLTAAAFVPDPFGAAPGQRLYRTGDRARWRADGRLEFLGRIDRQLKVRGLRIEPGEIEAALCRSPGVRQAVVVAREDRPGDQRLVAYLTAEETAAAAREELRRELVGSWRELYESTYREAPPAADPLFDVAGWRSSYDGEPIPPEQMREWVGSTVERILSLGARRVLEIGCGTGLLLFRLAPRCERYFATDFSRAALESIAARPARGGGGLPGLTLLERPADDFSGFQAGELDLVVLNSIAQYFPDAGYLECVLAGAARVVRPGGAVFVGDVRSLPLLTAFHESVALHRGRPGTPVSELRERAGRQAANEEELVVDPRFFAALAARVREIGAVEVRLKRGRSANEMVRYRYDALLWIGERAGDGPRPRWRRWGEGGLDMARLRRILTGERPPELAVTGVPNRRVSAGLAGVDPEEMWELGEACSYQVWAGWAETDDPGAFDAVFRRDEPAVAFLPSPGAGTARLTNDPLAVRASRRRTARLREDLRRELPAFMVPRDFVFLDALPVTPQGKIDREALPAPEPSVDPEPGEGAAPRDPLEAELAAIWAEVLGVKEVGREQSFFELGGHSLLAIQLVYRLREALAADLAIAALFSAPTVAELAAEIRRPGRPAGEPRSRPALPDDAGSPRLPFPLTPIQRGLWERRGGAGPLDGGANVYQDLTAMDPDGAVAGRLDAAVARLIGRHEMLRAVVRADGRQEILPSVPPYHVEVADLRGWPPERVAARLASIRESFQTRVGDPGRWPLFEIAAHRLDGGALRLQAWFDALILDGPSREILCRELGVLVADPAAELPPLDFSYRDYALLADPERDGPQVILPPPIQPWAGAAGGARLVDRHARLVGPGPWQALRARAARAAVTPSALALAAFVEVFAHRRGGRGFSLGLVSSYRPPFHPGIGRVVGNFSRLVPLGVERWDGPFAADLRRLQERLSRSLDDRRPAAAGSWPPVLFNSLLETVGRDTGERSCLATVEVGAYWPGALLLATVAEDSEGGLECKWQAREESLPAGWSEKLLGEYQCLWGRLAAAPADWWI